MQHLLKTNFVSTNLRNWMLLAMAVSTLSACKILGSAEQFMINKFAKKGIEGKRFVSADAGRQVYYKFHGKPKLVLVHGFGASGIGQFYKSALQLQEDYDVILPDLLYCGRSMGDSVEFSIDGQVEHLKAILDSLGVDEPINLVGNSYGGIVSAYFAEYYPEMVNKLVIYDSPINCYSLSYADSLAKSLGVPNIDNILSPTTVYENKQSFDLIFYDQPWIPRPIRKNLVKHGSVPMRGYQIPLLNHLKENETAYNEHFFDFRMPVYLVWGDSDRLIPMSTMRCIQERYQIIDERVTIIPQAAHAFNVEYPDVFVDYIHQIVPVK
jgi:pimeloyl-ACP methyl ester carboxylesterase